MGTLLIPDIFQFRVLYAKKYTSLKFSKMYTTAGCVVVTNISNDPILPTIDQGGISCGAINEPRKSSKAIDERVILNFCDKNVVIARFRDTNGGFLLFIYVLFIFIYIPLYIYLYFILLSKCLVYGCSG